jgi:hypothetical protein
VCFSCEREGKLNTEIEVAPAHVLCHRVTTRVPPPAPTHQRYMITCGLRSHQWWVGAGGGNLACHLVCAVMHRRKYSGTCCPAQSCSLAHPVTPPSCCPAGGWAPDGHALRAQGCTLLRGLHPGRPPARCVGVYGVCVWGRQGEGETGESCCRCSCFCCSRCFPIAPAPGPGILALCHAF